MNSKTIALVLPSLPKYSETFIANKIKGLLSNNFKVVLLVVGVSEKPEIEVPVYFQPVLPKNSIMRWVISLWIIFKTFIAAPIRTIRLIKNLPNSRRSLFEKFRSIVVLSNFLKVKVDWIHFSYGSLAIERAIIGKVIEAKIGVSFRGYDIGIYPLKNKGIYDSIWEHIDKVHFISKDLEKIATEIGMPADINTEIIYPAIDINRFKNTVERDWGDCKKVLFVGRLHWKKGLDYVIKAISILSNDVELTIVGEGSEYERLSFSAHQLGVSNQIHFVGKKTPNQVKELMISHNYLVQYSVQEGFSNAVLEAQSCGMLCITSDAEGLSENVINDKTGWVIPKRNSELLAAKIKEIMNLSAQVKRSISEAAIKRVHHNFDLENQNKKFAGFFEQNSLSN